jgi:hypothetical protein
MIKPYIFPSILSQLFQLPEQTSLILVRSDGSSPYSMNLNLRILELMNKFLQIRLPSVIAKQEINVFPML